MRNINTKLYFDHKYYDNKYYSSMAPGNFAHFQETKGQSLLSNRLSDLARVKILPGMQVLDIGCGRGELVMYSALKGAITYGIDYSDEAIKIAKECLCFYNPEIRQNIHLFKTSIESLPFNNIVFDRIMSWASIEHFHQWQWKEGLKNIYNLLKDDGVIIVGTHPNALYQNIGYTLIRPFKQIILGKYLPTSKELNEIDLKNGHVNLKTPGQLKKDFIDCGFKVKIYLSKRNEYEINNRIAKILGTLLEGMPLVNILFREEIIAVAAKSEEVLNKFVKLKSNKLIG